MIKIITIIGARPQIIKAAALSRAIKNKFTENINEVIVHTGQHYDENMSNVFFDELQIPRPDYNLNVGSSTHGKQTAIMIQGIEEILIKEEPDFIILYGDTNSTLAGAVAATKIHIPIAHIEAGLRSFNKKMPEEINRITCDHASTLLFSPTKTGYYNLVKEGFNIKNKAPYTIDNPGVYHCGDVMYDNSLFFADIADKKSNIINELDLKENEFILGTIHRNNNTDEPDRLNAIFSAINKISFKNKITTVLPLHPRTANLLNSNLSKGLYKEIMENTFIRIIKAVSFLDMIALEKNAKLVMTDSGGVQKEAYFFNKACIIMRSETEWKEIVENKTAIVADADEQKIIESYNFFINKDKLNFPGIFGDGNAAEFICNEILRNVSKDF